MRLGVLGPQLVMDKAGREVTARAARQRALLAGVTLRSYVRRLHQTLDPTLGPGRTARIVTHPPR